MIIAAASNATPKISSVSPTTRLLSTPSSITTPKKKYYYRTVIQKGEYGIGLDLGKTEDGRVLVQRLKELPPGVINPASRANPPVKAGDFIVSVQGQTGLSFADTVKVIRSSTGGIDMGLERIEY
jgi:C-terminal processing protease CtpA/Prc